MIQDVSQLASRQQIDPTRVFYSNEALSADLRRLGTMWEEIQCKRRVSHVELDKGGKQLMLHAGLRKLVRAYEISLLR